MEFREWKDRRKSDSKRGGLSSGCLPARRFRLKNVINTDDKSEHVPHWEDSVRIIIDCLSLTKKMQPNLFVNPTGHLQNIC